MQSQGPKVTSLNLYLALAKLDLILTQGMGATPLSDAEMTAAVTAFDVACIADFRAQAGTHLCSELFTAKAVGELVVTLAVEQGVIEADAAHGLAVQLHAEISPVLREMLVSFNRCLGAVLSFLASLPGAVAAAQLGALVGVNAAA
jgi:hypothetical protein